MGMGMGIDGDDVNREEVEKLVRELMEREKGKELKKKAMEWKDMVGEAISTSGSSTLNLDNLVVKLMRS